MMQLFSRNNYSGSNYTSRISFSWLKMSTLLQAVFAALLLSACAHTNQVSQDFKPGTDYKDLRTFAWHNISSEIPNVDNIAIQRVIEENLTQQGYKLVETNPDFVLDIHIIAQTNTAPSSGLGLSIGLPIGSHGSLGVGTSKILSRDNHQQGLIIVDITTQHNNQVVWRGTAEAIPMSHFSMRNEPQLKAVLKKLMEQFPPR